MEFALCRLVQRGSVALGAYPVSCPVCARSSLPVRGKAIEVLSDKTPASRNEVRNMRSVTFTPPTNVLCVSCNELDVAEKDCNFSVVKEISWCLLDFRLFNDVNCRAYKIAVSIK
jgi:hypothetical protein